MSQQLLDLIDRFGGPEAVSSMATRVGLSPEQAQSAMAALMPAVAGGMAKQVEAGGPAALDSAATPAVALASGQTIASDAAVAHGHGLVGQFFGSSAVAEEVTSRAATATGLDMSKIAALLPMVATLAAGALGHAGQAVTPAAPAAQANAGGLLGNLLDQFTSAPPARAEGAPQGGAAATLLSMLDFNKDGNPMDDIMGLVGKLRDR
ncbi:MAG: DUF937 domain-containing protein [Janthinobacterium lividum]